jgi:hypothetical protein
MHLYTLALCQSVVMPAVLRALSTLDMTEQLAATNHLTIDKITCKLDRCRQDMYAPQYEAMDSLCYHLR